MLDYIPIHDNDATTKTMVQLNNKTILLSDNNFMRIYINSDFNSNNLI